MPTDDANVQEKFPDSKKEGKNGRRSAPTSTGDGTMEGGRTEEDLIMLLPDLFTNAHRLGLRLLVRARHTWCMFANFRMRCRPFV